MADDLIGYDALTREALRGVVREALRKVAEHGRPGDHHFYITFRTHAPGVDLDRDLLDKHPEDMTIVLERRFWDLAVEDDAFEVTLSFNRAPKYIRVPFAAVTQFHDPSVGFTLRFEPPPPGSTARSPNAAAHSAGVKAQAGPKAKPASETAEASPESPPAGQVVSLEAFRKKSD